MVQTFYRPGDQVVLLKLKQYGCIAGQAFHQRFQQALQARFGRKISGQVGDDVGQRRQGRGGCQNYTVLWVSHREQRCRSDTCWGKTAGNTRGERPGPLVAEIEERASGRAISLHYTWSGLVTHYCND